MTQGWAGGPPTPEQPPHRGLPWGRPGGAPGQATGWEQLSGPVGSRRGPGGGPNPWGPPPRPPQDHGAKLVAVTAAVTLAVAGAGAGLYLGLSGGGSRAGAVGRPAASAAVSATQPAAHRPTDSPRDVVTAFFNAAGADDFNAAVQLVCPSMRPQLDPRQRAGAPWRSFTVDTPVRSGGEWKVPVEIVADDQTGSVVSVTVTVVHENAKYLVCGIDLSDSPSDPYSGGPSVSADPSAPATLPGSVV